MADTSPPKREPSATCFQVPKDPQGHERSLKHQRWAWHLVRTTQILPLGLSVPLCKAGSPTDKVSGSQVVCVGRRTWKASVPAPPFCMVRCTVTFPVAQLRAPARVQRWQTLAVPPATRAYEYLDELQVHPVGERIRSISMIIFNPHTISP